MTIDKGVALEQINRKKRIILCFGVILMFFTSMSKVLVSGPIHQVLLTEMNLTPGQIAGMGAAYMYSYAASQFLSGIFPHRYGGGRILLIGGSLFTVGMILFTVLNKVQNYSFPLNYGITVNFVL